MTMLAPYAECFNSLSAICNAPEVMRSVSVSAPLAIYVVASYLFTLARSALGLITDPVDTL